MPQKIPPRRSLDSERQFHPEMVGTERWSHLSREHVNPFRDQRLVDRDPEPRQPRFVREPRTPGWMITESPRRIVKARGFEDAAECGGERRGVEIPREDARIAGGIRLQRIAIDCR